MFIFRHGKFESIGSLFLSLTLVATGVSVGTWSYERMHFVLAAQRLATSAAATSSAATAVAVQIPTWPALLLAAISIGSKEWLYRVTKRVGVLLNSQIVIANAWHHRSDAFSSVLSLFSIAVAIALPKLVFMDSAAGILIAGMISLSGLEILFESIKSLSDTSDRALADSIKALALSVDDGVLGVNKIRTRNVGSSSIVDLTILTDTKITASAAQSLSERVRWKLLDAFPQVVDALVRTHSTSTPCPLLSQSLKPSIDIEKEVKTLIMTQKDVINIQDIKRVNIYYINAAIVTVEVVLRLKEEISQDNGITLKDAQYISDTVTNLIKTNIQDILQVDVLIDLSGKSVEIETAESIASLK